MIKEQDWLRLVLRTLQGGLVLVKILNGSCKPKWQGCEHNIKFEEKTHLHFIKVSRLCQCCVLSYLMTDLFLHIWSY